MASAPPRQDRGIAWRLWMACAPDAVRPAVASASAFLEEQGLAPEERTDCELALAEACNNAVQYVRPGGQGDPISLQICCLPSEVEIQVADNTSGFEPAVLAALPPADCERGRGLFIIQSLMDRTQYLRCGEQNRMVLIKKRCFQSHAQPEQDRSSLLETRQLLAEQRETIKNLAKELCFRSETLRAIFQCSADLGRSHDLQEFCRRLLIDLTLITSTDWYVLRLAQPGENFLTVAAASESSGPWERLNFPDSRNSIQSVEVQAAVTGKDTWFDHQLAFDAHDPLARFQPEAHGLVHPLVFGDTLIGTVALGRRRPQPQLSLQQVEVVHMFGEFLSIQIMNARFQQERLELRLVSHELDIARAIQRALRPRTLPQVRGYGLAAVCETARQVGGDLYDVVRVSDEEVWLVVADVMGKGVPAALFASVFRSLVRALPSSFQRPSERLSQVNQLMFEELSRVDMFITAQLAVLDLKRGQLTISSAGHCPVLLAGSDGLREVSSNGVPIGVVPDGAFSDVTVVLPSNSRVLLYTDGVPEAANPLGELFGPDRLKIWLENSCVRPASAEGLKAELAGELLRFQSLAPVRDDQTFLLLVEEALGGVQEKEGLTGHPPPISAACPQ